MERDLPAGGVAIASSASVEPARDGGSGALYRALLAPRSVALIGASDDPAKTTGRPLRFLRQAWSRVAASPPPASGDE